MSKQKNIKNKFNHKALELCTAQMPIKKLKKCARYEHPPLEEHIQDLMGYIRQTNMVQPIIIGYTECNGVVVMDGSARIAAMERLFCTHVPVIELADIVSWYKMQPVWIHTKADTHNNKEI
jgi:hypothetical protein